MRIYSFVRFILFVCCVWLTIVLLTLIGTLLQSDTTQEIENDRELRTVLSGLLKRNRSYLLKTLEEVGVGEFHDDRRFKHRNIPRRSDPWNDPNSPGYGGKGVHMDPNVMNPIERALYNKGYESHNFNEFASDLISVRRRLINITEPECLARQYDYDKLPTAGVVVIFHNEAWSTLLRTVHSILENTSPSLLTEIVLVDDASDKKYLGRPLTDYVSQLGDKVRLVRHETRLGLMVARNAGCDHVTGEVCAFLDSHCEVPEMWIEPLLERIRLNDRVLAVPTTDNIDSDSFAYWKSDPATLYKGGLDLDMYFAWIPQSKEDLARNSLLDPIKSPTHLGCCFAISKANFLRLGKYDPGLQIWGCENQELSFKIWMCGGEIEIIPCSHVGHMFRFMAPWSWGKGKSDPDRLHKNCLRVSEVWMDEYKLLHHERIYNRQLDFGDVSDRKALRAQLQCKSFDWFVKNVYPTLHIFTGGAAIGRITSAAVTEKCVQSPVHNYGRIVTADYCSEYSLIQFFTLTKEKTIRRDDGCLDYDGSESLVVAMCDDNTNIQWQYTEDDALIHLRSGRCLELAEDDVKLRVVPCDTSSRQRWNWDRRTVTLNRDELE